MGEQEVPRRRTSFFTIKETSELCSRELLLCPFQIYDYWYVIARYNIEKTCHNMLGNNYVKVLSRLMKVLCAIFVSNRVSERGHFFFTSHIVWVSLSGCISFSQGNFIKGQTI